MIGIAKLETPIHPIHWDMDNEIYMKEKICFLFLSAGTKPARHCFFLMKLGKGILIQS